MSVVGIDLGNLNTVQAQTSKGGIDCILNDASNRQTAVCVGIQGKQRFLGDAASAAARSNLKQTFFMFKNLVGREFDEPEVQKELSNFAYTACKLPSGGIGISMDYNDESIVVPIEHVLAMMLVRIKDICKTANGGQVGIADAVIGIPAWFSDAQRRAYMKACEIAELNCLKLVHESTAIALSYGIYKSAKKLFSETEPEHVMFIDVGYSCFTVSIVDFIQEKLIVRATECDNTIGGRFFDDIIVEFMCAEFEAKTKINVRNNKKALRMLEGFAEKAKKTLSPAGVTDARINVECLADDRDLGCVLKKDFLEGKAESMVQRMAGPINAALASAGLKKEDLKDVEIVGGTSRINCIKQFIGSVLGLDATALNYGLKTTMNADEATARGATLQCAIESSRLKVKPFSICDRMPYGIVVDTGGQSTSTSESKEDEDSGASSNAMVELYAAGDAYPKPARRITFKGKKNDFTFVVSYDSASHAKMPVGTSPVIGKYTIRVPEGYSSSDGYDVRVTFTVDKFMCFQVIGAQLMEPLPLEEVKEETKVESKEGESKEGEAKEGEEKEGETKDEPPKPPKRKFKKVDLTMDSWNFGLTSDDVKNASEIEAKMANQDRILIETSDRRNDLETYIYAMRTRMDGDLHPFASPAEKQDFNEKNNAAEDWLYGDGFDATKKEYVEKLAVLKAIGDKMEVRMYESNNRKSSCDQLRRVIDSCKQFASNADEAYSHINDDERDQIRGFATETEKWLFDLLDRQGALEMFNDPLLTVAEVNKKRSALFTNTNPIMTKPKPKPDPVPEPPKPDPMPEESKGEDKATEGTSEGGEGQAAEGEGMDVETE